MMRQLVRSAVLAVAAVTARGVSAQTGEGGRARIIVAPQVGAVVSHSRGAQENAAATLVAEVPLGRGWSVAAEWMHPYGSYALQACPPFPGAGCVIGAELRSAGSVGVVVRPLRLGPLEPYAGVSTGIVRWAYNWDSGLAPMAALRTGIDLQVAGPFGLRAELVRRVAWTDSPNGSPLHTDMVSVGARIAFRP